jgi:hypothetical protein
MRYLSESDMTQMMGSGYLGEVRQGPDGNLYQYVQGVDGLGNPIGGFWSRLKKVARGVVRKALPLAQQFAPFIPGGAAALTAVTPFLKQAGVAGYDGIGALYESPDGSLYQVQGLEEDEDLRGIDEDSMTQIMGIGYLGEVRQGPDGNLYQYVQGVDGLGNPVGGFWSRLKKIARGVVRKALPLAQQFAPFIPGGAAVLTAATPILQQAGVARYGGLGALYQAPDGTLYQMQGLADDDLRGLDEDEELRGFADDEELRSLDEDEELRGFADDEELRGLEEDEELRGFAEDEELHGLDEDPDMQGFDGYVRQDGMSGLERFEPERPPQTRWYVAPNQPPEVWKPLW